MVTLACLVPSLVSEHLAAHAGSPSQAQVGITAGVEWTVVRYLVYFVKCAPGWLADDAGVPVLCTPCSPEQA